MSEDRILNRISWSAYPADNAALTLGIKKSKWCESEKLCRKACGNIHAPVITISHSNCFHFVLFMYFFVATIIKFSRNLWKAVSFHSLTVVGRHPISRLFECHFIFWWHCTQISTPRAANILAHLSMMIHHFNKQGSSDVVLIDLAQSRLRYLTSNAVFLCLACYKLTGDYIVLFHINSSTPKIRLLILLSGCYSSLYISQENLRL